MTMLMRSSLKLNTVSAIGKDEQKKLNIIINFLYESSDAYEFREPVDWKSKFFKNEYRFITERLLGSS